MKIYDKVHINNMTMCCHKLNCITYGKHHVTICKYGKKVYMYHMCIYDKTYGRNVTICKPLLKGVPYVDIQYN